MTVDESELDELFALVAGRFFRPEPRRRTRAYVRGLLAPLAGQNARLMGAVAGEGRPDGMQRLLNAAAWDADGVRDDVRGYLAGRIGHRDGVLVASTAGFPRRGSTSAGVQRQVAGPGGRLEHCQLGVFLGYAGPAVTGLLDRELYLPGPWIADRERCRAAAVPEDVGYAGTAELAQAEIERALDAGVPARWVAAAEDLGPDHGFRTWLEQRGIGYVVVVPGSHPLPAGWFGVTRVDRFMLQAPSAVPGRTTVSGGPPGSRCEWMSTPVPANPERLPAGWTRRLLIRRRATAGGEPELTHHLCCGPADTPDEELIRVTAAYRAVRDGLRNARDDVGLAHYQVRRYDAWYRHITLAMLAHAVLVAQATAAQPRRS